MTFLTRHPQHLFSKNPMFTQIHPKNQNTIYTPFATGTYSVAPGLTLLAKANFGNGKIDQQIFQIDNCYNDFIKHKTSLALTQPQHHILSHNLNISLASTIQQFITQTLLKEHSLNLELVKHITPKPYKNSTEQDIICQYIQEDIAIIQQIPAAKSTPHSNIIRYLHISSPNYWAPEEKIGKTFKDIHSPVVGMNLDVEHQIITAITTKGHYLRIERQVAIPFPQHHAALFLIHPYFTDIATLSTDHKTQLLNAINSMTPQQKQYKGLTDVKELVEWIKQEAH